jgi:hypothetical protein
MSEVHYFDELPSEMPEEFQGTMAGFVRVKIHDAEGKLKTQTQWKQSQSFVQTFLQLIHFYIAEATTENIVTNIDGTDTDVYTPMNDSYEDCMQLNAGSGVDSYGIVVGSGTGAESNTDYALDTKITDGSGAGQLEYGSQGFVGVFEVAGNVDMIINRVFFNNSGSGVTVEEIGVYIWNNSPVATDYFCIIRDLLNFTVNNGESATVEYTLRITP